MPNIDKFKSPCRIQLSYTPEGAVITIEDIAVLPEYKLPVIGEEVKADTPDFKVITGTVISVDEKKHTYTARFDLK